MASFSLWFSYTVQLAEIMYDAKLDAYREACESLAEEAASSLEPSADAAVTAARRACVLSGCHLERPKACKQAEECADSVEQEKEMVYRELDDGFTVTAEDEAALRACSVDGEVTDPEAARRDTAEARQLLYGELTSTGVRQLHQLTTALVHAARASRAGRATGSPVSAADPAPALAGGAATGAASGRACSVASGTDSDAGVAGQGGATATSSLAASLVLDAGFIMEAVDIGCGTGKLLFEWSRLAASQYLQHPLCSRTAPSSERASPAARSVGGGRHSEQCASGRGGSDAGSAHERLSGSGTTSLASSFTLSSAAAITGLVPQEASARGTAGSCSSAIHSPVRDAIDGVQFGSSGRSGAVDLVAAGRDGGGRSAPPPVLEASALVGWLGVGIELAPSRVHVARCALAPNYLDLRRKQRHGHHAHGHALPDAETVLQPDPPAGGTSHAATATAVEEAERQFTPAPPQTVVVEPKRTQLPTGRQPAGCVLLYEGDALARGLLTSSTLFRFPRPAGTRGAAQTPHRDVDGGEDIRPRPSPLARPAHPLRQSRVPGTENYFRLCRGVPRHGSLTGAEDIHLVVFCSGLGFDEPFTRRLCSTLEALLPGCPRAQKRHEPAEAAAGIAPAAAGTWMSITCVLLLRAGMPLTDADFPLFRCCESMEGDAASAQPPRAIPDWCWNRQGSPGQTLRASSASKASLSTTWMDNAPVWVLHYRYGTASA